MRLISHRANLRGPDPTRENQIWAIEECIQLGYQVEVDLWVENLTENWKCNTSFYLNHEIGINLVNISWILENQHHLLIHCKNKEAVEFAIKELDGEWFVHDKDKWSATSEAHLICYVEESDILNDKSVIVMMPEHHNIKNIPTGIYGICTDYVEKYSGKV